MKFICMILLILLASCTEQNEVNTPNNTTVISYKGFLLKNVAYEKIDARFIADPIIIEPNSAWIENFSLNFTKSKILFTKKNITGVICNGQADLAEQDKNEIIKVTDETPFCEISSTTTCTYFMPYSVVSFDSSITIESTQVNECTPVAICELDYYQNLRDVFQNIIEQKLLVCD